jgi:hypothetical protein
MMKLDGGDQCSRNITTTTAAAACILQIDWFTASRPNLRGRSGDGEPHLWKDIRHSIARTEFWAGCRPAIVLT